MQAMPPSRDAEALSVGELTARIKDLLEGTLPEVWVRGEISNLRQQASGHAYFTLKDERAQLSAVLFRGDAARQRVPLRDGQQVVAFGQVSVYEARGQYQLIVRALVEDGVGRLQVEFERLKQQLAAEGLFEAANKVPLPALPRTIGFITSPTGAAVQDFLRILQRREWRGRVVVLPAKVQGAGAAAEMVELLELAQRMTQDRKAETGNEKPEAGNRKRRRKQTLALEQPELPVAEGALPDELSAFRSPTSGLSFDLLVIGRGGGSLEDLWAFNEESLVRAVAACQIPIISAVGHEIDFTLCDFAADARAETPSAAAELISSGFLDRRDRVSQAAGRIHELTTDALARADDRLGAARDRLRLLAPSTLVEQNWLRLDDLSNRLGSAFRHALTGEREKLARLHHRLERASPEMRVRFESQRLLGLWKRLQAASPASVLNRGFAIVRDAGGRPLPRRTGAQPGQSLRVQFADGELPVRAE